MNRKSRRAQRGPKLSAFEFACMAHFEELRPPYPEKEVEQRIKGLTCCKCEDYKYGYCKGQGRSGEACLDCMEEKVFRGID